jgi:hypothetical protein
MAWCESVTLSMKETLSFALPITSVTLVAIFVGAGIAQWYSAATVWVIRDSNPSRGWEFFSSPPLGPTQPPIQWVAGAPSLEVKWPGHEAGHSPQSSAEVKNAWSYTSTPPVRLHGVVLG